MILANTQGTKMNLFRRASSPRQRETPTAPFPWSNSLKKVKYFLATFHYGWHTHGKFEIMLILLLWTSSQSNNLHFLKRYKLWGCFSCFSMGAREPWQRKGSTRLWAANSGQQTYLRRKLRWTNCVPFTNENPTLVFLFQKGRCMSPMVFLPKTSLWMAAFRKMISS